MFKQLNPILPVKEILKEINGLADEMAGLSNLELKNKTQELEPPHILAGHLFQSEIRLPLR